MAGRCQRARRRRQWITAAASDAKGGQNSGYLRRGDQVAVAVSVPAHLTRAHPARGTDPEGRRRARWRIGGNGKLRIYECKPGVDLWP
jgi:hypothetical protein